MLLSPWDFPGKITGMGCHFLKKMAFPPSWFGQFKFPEHCKDILGPWINFVLLVLFWQTDEGKLTPYCDFKLSIFSLMRPSICHMYIGYLDFLIWISLNATKEIFPYFEFYLLSNHMCPEYLLPHSRLSLHTIFGDSVSTHNFNLWSLTNVVVHNFCI